MVKLYIILNIIACIAAHIRLLNLNLIVNNDLFCLILINFNFNMSKQLQYTFLIQLNIKLLKLNNY